LAAIEGKKDYFPLGEVPLEWLQKRILGIATAEGEYADICSSEWISRLRKSLAAHLSKFGIENIDAAVLQKTAPQNADAVCIAHRLLRRLLWDSLPVEVWARHRELGSI
jgi:hypothetical protein